MRKGDNLKAFLKAGLRKHHRPAVAAALIVSGILISAMAAQDIRNASASPTPTAMTQSETNKASTAELLRDQSALRRLVRLETGAADAALHRGPDGKPFSYPIPDFDRAVLAHIARVQQAVDPVSNKAVDPLYGIDDGMWAWMMRNHAREAGLSAAMEGITVNENGSIDAASATKLNAMLELKNDPVAATKLFVRWLSAEAMEFDGHVGRPPTPGELSLIALSDSERAADIASMAKNHPKEKVAGVLQIVPGEWKRTFFAGRDGWLGAADAMAAMEAGTEKLLRQVGDLIPVRQTETPSLDEDFTTAELRKDPERFARIVARAGREMAETTRAQVDAIMAAAGQAGFAEDPLRHQRIGGSLMSLATSIDEIRGDSVAGGIYAIGEGQWIAAAKTYGDPDFVGSFMAGIEQKDDGSIHAASAEQFGSFMRLRDDPAIASQIVLPRLVAQTHAMQRDLGRMPDLSEVMVSHLFGLAAGEAFARAAEKDENLDRLEFSPGDPRKVWEDEFLPSAGGWQKAVLLKDRLESIARDHTKRTTIFMDQQEHADAGPTFDPGAELGRLVDRGVDAINGAVGLVIGRLTEAASHAAHRPAPDEDVAEAPRPRM